MPAQWRQEKRRRDRSRRLSVRHPLPCLPPAPRTRGEIYSSPPPMPPRPVASAKACCASVSTM
ncbi:hypothetical protein D2V04_16515 [Pelagerythrobacter aerophilus]|uniref:Uncharacterized protein n=1 Tax=Pelagerythrobacter aerophilus TaxID=2306995 RepID=A0A418NE76_9SPHN|nr:hypothetical protein D2V04_16515 [Pelagerythrobacter aerophilus]